MFSKPGCFEDVPAWVLRIVASPAIAFAGRFGRGQDEQAIEEPASRPLRQACSVSEPGELAMCLPQVSARDGLNNSADRSLH